MDPAQSFLVQDIARHRVINETIARGDSPIQQFYAGAVIFITGASGFLGKQLVEKLLRSCDIKKIYILLRPKKKKAFEDRIKDLVNDPVYEVLKQSKPNFTDKIIPIKGDVSEVGLAISEEDKKKIIDEVTIIFHGAATINFVESLKTSTFTNIRGCAELMKLAKECKKLKSYVHISTAYCHATHPRSGCDVMEEFYQSPIAPTAMIELAEQLDENKLDAITNKLITNWPNTYSFTKAIGEEAVRTMAGDLPICIVRPAIVIHALREPLPGWIDMTCAFGPTGLILGSGLGVLRVVRGDRNINLDVVPVDLVNNSVIAAAYETAMRRARAETDIKIYTVTGTKNPMKLGKLCDSLTNNGRVYSTEKSVLYAFAYMTTNPLIYYIFSWILHYIPAYIIDGVLRLLGKQPLLIKIFNKMIKLNAVLNYFMMNEWYFGDSNQKQLYWNLSPTDRLIFDSNMANIDWDHYLILWCISARKYILKDGLSSTRYAVKKQLFLQYIGLIILLPYLYALYKVAYFVIYGIFCVLLYNFNLLKNF